MVSHVKSIPSLASVHFQSRNQRRLWWTACRAGGGKPSKTAMLLELEEYFDWRHDIELCVQHYETTNSKIFTFQLVLFARRKNKQCVGPTGVPFTMCRLFTDTVIKFVNYRASSQRRKPLIESTASLMQCTLIIFVIQGVFYAAGLLTVERTSFLLSDHWCRLFCKSQPRSVPRYNKLSV
jgi:hypothetical protein